MIKLTIETKIDKFGDVIAVVVMEGMGDVPMKTKIKGKASEKAAMEAALHLVKHIYL